MDYVVAIDPGLRACGVAVFTNGELTWCALVKNPEQKARGPAAWRSMGVALHQAVSLYHMPKSTVWVVEQQQVYRFGKGDPADLLELSGVVGAAVAGTLTSSKLIGYLPRQWKGQVPKATMVARIRERMRPSERVVLAEAAVAPSLEHNVVDAIGLGMYYLRRV